MIIPGALVGPMYFNTNKKMTLIHQAAKAKANGVAEETIGNIRTVKAFAEEKGSLEKFKKFNYEIFLVALRKGNQWGMFMFLIKLFTSSALAGLILFVNYQVQTESSLSIGVIMAYLLYMQTVTRNLGEMITQIQNIAKVNGAAVKVCTLIGAESRITFDKHEKPETN
jgi:ATP-binding cassette subfamily B (MDR/TAP) protein 8